MYSPLRAAKGPLKGLAAMHADPVTHHHPLAVHCCCSHYCFLLLATAVQLPWEAIVIMTVSNQWFEDGRCSNSDICTIAVFVCQTVNTAVAPFRNEDQYCLTVYQ